MRAIIIKMEGSDLQGIIKAKIIDQRDHLILMLEEMEIDHREKIHGVVLDFYQEISKELLPKRHENDIKWFVSGENSLHTKENIMKAVDKFDGNEFEHFVGYLFETRGFEVKVTQKTCDYGADLIVKKNGSTTAVQVKRYKEKVTQSAVKEVTYAMKYYNCDKAIIVTNSSLHVTAKKVARKFNYQTIERPELIAWIEEHLTYLRCGRTCGPIEEKLILYIVESILQRKMRPNINWTNNNITYPERFFFEDRMREEKFDRLIDVLAKRKNSNIEADDTKPSTKELTIVNTPPHELSHKDPRQVISIESKHPDLGGFVDIKIFRDKIRSNTKQFSDQGTRVQNIGRDDEQFLKRDHDFQRTNNDASIQNIDLTPCSNKNNEDHKMRPLLITSIIGLMIFLFLVYQFSAVSKAKPMVNHLNEHQIVDNKRSKKQPPEPPEHSASLRKNKIARTGENILKDESPILQMIETPTFQLDESEEMFDFVNDRNETNLFEAVLCKDSFSGDDIVEITCFDDINHQNCDGDTALIFAARIGDPTKVRNLIQMGADPGIANNDGETAYKIVKKIIGVKLFNVKYKPYRQVKRILKKYE